MNAAPRNLPPPPLNLTLTDSYFPFSLPVREFGARFAGMGLPLAIQKKLAPPGMLSSSSLRDMLPLTLGLSACGFPPLFLGAYILTSWYFFPSTPAWTVSFGLLCLGVGASVLSLLPSLFEIFPQKRLDRRRLRWIGTLLPRVALILTLVNLLLGAYLGALQQAAGISDEIISTTIGSINLAALALVLWTTPNLRPLQPTIDTHTLLEVHAGALRENVRCPYCASPLSPGEAVSCLGCETLHHQDCWQENTCCTTFGCAETEALTLGGHLIQ
jgi:hypothetical protein